ncbi:MAG: cupin domain-containing protein [Gammaproteobacteria bacterium]|nr:cupin domain-containing protein [Gammaproteobacteria bacterium]
MALPQDISPVNSELMDGLAAASQMEWMDYDQPGGKIKVLWLGAESGRWAVLFKWDKGFVAPPHKHLSAAFAFILKGKLQVRDGTLDEGDFVYEPNGMVPGATTALEDTEYLFFCHRLVLFNDEEEGFTSYLGWEELERIRQANEAAAAMPQAATA